MVIYCSGLVSVAALAVLIGVPIATSKSWPDAPGSTTEQCEAEQSDDPSVLQVSAERGRASYSGGLFIDFELLHTEINETLALLERSSPAKDGSGQLISLVDFDDNYKLVQPVLQLRELARQVEKHRDEFDNGLSTLSMNVQDSKNQDISELIHQTFQGHEMSDTLQSLQLYLLQHSETSQQQLRLIRLTEGVAANDPPYLVTQKKKYGDTFLCAGQVVLSDRKSLELSLTQPQARTTQLGTSSLEPKVIPTMDIGGRNVLLITLSQAGAGGNGDYEGFRGAYEHYLFNEQAESRRLDDVSARILKDLVKAYKTMDTSPGTPINSAIVLPNYPSRSFWEAKDGLGIYFIKYLHYYLFGLDPDDKKTMDTLWELYYGKNQVLSYFAKIFTPNGVPNARLVNTVQRIYERSPALKHFKSEKRNSWMTLAEFARGAVALIAIAGSQGPKHAAQTAMGFRPFPTYPNSKVRHFKQTTVWDKLDLNNRDEVKKYLLECIRLNTPVSTGHRVAPEPFSARIGGKQETFPAGTQITVPLNIGLTDEAFWGKTALEFDHLRPNLQEDYMAFNSYGSKGKGRECPGRKLAEDMLTDALIAIGHVRQQRVWQ